MTRTTDSPDRGQRPRARGGVGRFIRSPETAESDALACKMRSEGATYAEVAKTLGYSDPSAARKAVVRALATIVAEPAAHLKTLELVRLDAAVSVAMRIMLAEHVVISGGRIVVDDDGKPLRDSGPNLAAIDRVVKLSDQRSKLCNMYPPVKIEAVTVDAVEAEIARLAAELGMNDDTEAATR